jgi:hypothetical protein
MARLATTTGLPHLATIDRGIGTTGEIATTTIATDCMIAHLLRVLWVLVVLFIPIGLQWLLLLVLQDRMDRR